MSLLVNKYQKTLPWPKHDTEHSLLSSDGVQTSVWRFATSIPPYIFIVWCLGSNTHSTLI